MLKLSVDVETRYKRLLALAVLVILTITVIHSYILGLLAFIAPYDGSQPLNVTSLGTYDGSSPSTSFSRSSTVNVTVIVEKAEGYYNASDPPQSVEYFSVNHTTDYFVIISIKGPDNNILFAYESSSLTTSNLYVHSLDIDIPDDAVTGVYTIKVLLWDNWGQNTNSLIPKDDIRTTTFEVTT